MYNYYGVSFNPLRIGSDGNILLIMDTTKMFLVSIPLESGQMVMKRINNMKDDYRLFQSP